MKVITKQGSSKQGDYTYYAEITQVGDNDYTVAYMVQDNDTDDSDYCPVNSQFCDIVNCDGCVHWDNGYKLQHMTQAEVDSFVENANNQNQIQ